VRVRIISINCDKYLHNVTSPDEDGDNAVALTDLSVLQQAFVHQSPLYQGDLNFDGVISLADLAFFQAHFVAVAICP
jgi:hypothetical protein